MKKRIPTFLSGMLTMALISALGVTALAATGQMTITVDPVNIQVNGATFQPKDANGADVPVFAHNGTTYAPLRALAEAYGLTVGYDQEANMATVGETAPTPDTTATTYSDWTDEDEAAYQEFKGMWEVSPRDKGDKKCNVFGECENTPWESYTLICIDSHSYTELIDIFQAAKEVGFTDRLALEIRSSDILTELYFWEENGPMVGSVIVE